MAYLEASHRYYLSSVSRDNQERFVPLAYEVAKIWRVRKDAEVYNCLRTSRTGVVGEETTPTPTTTWDDMPSPGLVFDEGDGRSGEKAVLEKSLEQRWRAQYPRLFQKNSADLATLVAESDQERVFELARGLLGTSGGGAALGAFRFTGRGRVERLDENLSGVPRDDRDLLLWHGTRPQSLYGIMRSCLKPIRRIFLRIVLEMRGGR